MTTKRPLDIVLDDDQDEPERIYRCAVCGKQGAWGEGWRWYGSWRQIDRGDPVVTVCSHMCRLRHAEDHGVDPVEVLP